MKQTLKKLSAFMMAMAISGALFAQVPQKFNYQGIARDTKGNPMAQQRMTLKLTVLPTSDATEGEYEEIQSVTTNEFGLYNLQIGNGTPVKGEMKTVKWETGNKYIKVAIDPKGGNDFVDAGTTQLLSVPYAIYADKAGMAKTTAGSDRAGTVSTSAAGTGTVNYLTKFTAANTIYNSQLFDNGTNVGIGTTTPSAKFHINQNVTGVQEHMRMQNLSTTGAGRFTLYSDGASNYSTFTKYGSAYAGSYAGLTGLYPFGNLLAFGNNGLASGDGLGRFLISTAGNAGISIFKGGTSKLKFHADFTTENVGIGGNSAPVSRVHLNNTDGTGMDLRLTNNTTGHTANDGFVIQNNGNAANIMNKESGLLSFGTSDLERARFTSSGDFGIGTTTPTAKLDVSGSSRFKGTTPLSFFEDVTIDGISPLNGLTIKASVGDNGAGLAFKDGDSSFINGQIFFGSTSSIFNGNMIFSTEDFGNTSDISINKSTKNVGIGVYNASAKLEVDGQVKITGGSPAIGKVLTSDASGLATWETPSGIDGFGSTDFIPKFTASNSLGNSLLRDNGTSIGVNISPSNLYQFYTYKSQLTANGDGQSSILGYRTRDSGNDGTGYGQSTSNRATSGYNFWGDVYTFGVAGHCYNDYSRTGGVLGAEVSGAYWGALGYRSSALINYGVYGSSAYANGAGFLPNNEVAGVGGGFFGNMVGSFSKGKVIGNMNAGELFATYNQGDVYTSGKSVELVDNGTNKVPAYAVTSTELTIYNNGKVQLQNGTAFIPFENNYSSLLADLPTVTASAMGACNGVYIESVTKEGIVIKELNNGTSNVQVSWISVGKRIDNLNPIPNELLSNQFDVNLKNAMYDDSKKENNGQAMWWDGEAKQLKFGTAPASTSPDNSNKVN
jgi:hypothetical protein